jgi:hypothetical protein
VLVAYDPLEMTKTIVTGLINDLNENCEGYEYQEILDFDLESKHAQVLKDFGSF